METEEGLSDDVADELAPLAVMATGVPKPVSEAFFPLDQLEAAPMG